MTLYGSKLSGPSSPVAGGGARGHRASHVGATLPTPELLTGGRSPSPRPSIPYFVHIPTRLDPTRRPVVAVHGIRREAEAQIKAFAPWAEETGRVVIAPLFTESDYPRYQKVVSDGCQADQALLGALRHIAETTGVDTSRFDLFGFSGGAQFAHRFALLHPERVGRLAVAAAGWYTLPDPAQSFPYGLAPPPGVGQAFLPNLEAFLALPTLILVGEQDTSRDATFRKDRGLDATQGRNRVQRAARWAKELRAAAARSGIPAVVRFRLVPNSGHSFQQCVDAGRLDRFVQEWFEQP